MHTPSRRILRLSRRHRLADHLVHQDADLAHITAKVSGRLSHGKAEAAILNAAEPDSQGLRMIIDPESDEFRPDKDVGAVGRWAVRLDRALGVALQHADRKEGLLRLREAVVSRKAGAGRSAATQLYCHYHAVFSTPLPVDCDPFARLLALGNTSLHTHLVMELADTHDKELAVDVLCGVLYVMCEQVWNAAKNVALIRAE